MAELVLLSPRYLYRVGEQVTVLCRLIEEAAAGPKVVYPEDVQIDVFGQGPGGAGEGKKDALRNARYDGDWQIGDIQLTADAPGQFTVVAHAARTQAELDVIVLSPVDYDEHWRSATLEAFLDTARLHTTDELASIVTMELLPAVEEQLAVAQASVSFEVVSQLEYRLAPPEGTWSVPKDAFVWHAELLLQAAMESIAGDGDLRIRLSAELERIVLQLTDTAPAHRGRPTALPRFLEIVQRSSEGQSGWEFDARLMRNFPTWELSYTRQWGSMPPNRSEKPELAPAGGGSRREPDETALASSSTG